MTSALVMAGVALPFVVSPGASFAITVTAAVHGDRRSAVKVWGGTALGILVLTLVTGLTGLGAAVGGSPTTRLVVGVAGGCVTAGFGAVMLRRELGGRAGPRRTGAGSPRLVLWAFVALVTNAKALSLYLLVVPTLAGAGTGTYLRFAAVHAAMLLVWLTLVGAAVVRVPGLRSERARRALGLLGGGFMVVLGAQTVVAAVA